MFPAQNQTLTTHPHNAMSPPKLVEHSQELYPIQEGKTTRRWSDTYYVQAFRLARAGYDGAELAMRLIPPIRPRTLQIFCKKRKEFADAIQEGKNASGKHEPQINNDITDTQKRFLIAYVIEGTISAAARTANCQRTKHHQWMNTDTENGAKYREAYEAAKAAHADYLYAEVRRRAVDGMRQYKFHQGKPVMIECTKEHPEAKRIVDDDGKVVYMRHYFELKKSDMLLCRLAELHIPGFRPDPAHITQNNNSGNTTKVDVNQLLDDLESGRRSNVLTLDAVDAYATKLIAEKTGGKE